MARALRPPGETTQMVLQLYLSGVTSPSDLMAYLGISESSVKYHLRVVRATLAQKQIVLAAPEKDCTHCAMVTACDKRPIMRRLQAAIDEAVRAGLRFKLIMDCPDMEPRRERTA